MEKTKIFNGNELKASEKKEKIGDKIESLWKEDACSPKRKTFMKKLKLKSCI